MNKKLSIYYVYLTGKNVAIGMQPVKAENKADARKRFKKRFPKCRVLKVEKANNPIAILSQSAIH